MAPKRGGWLATKAFLVASFAYVVGAGAVLHNTMGPTALLTWMALTFGIAAFYVIARLQKWKQQHEVVTGVTSGWIVALLMAMICLSGLERRVATMMCATGQPNPLRRNYHCSRMPRKTRTKAQSTNILDYHSNLSMYEKDSLAAEAKLKAEREKQEPATAPITKQSGAS